MTLLETINGQSYTKVDKRALTHKGCIVDVGCSGWDWSSYFIGKKRVIGIDPYESAISNVEFFEGLLGPVNGKALIHRNGADSTIIGDMDLDNSTDYVEFPMLNWKTFCKKFNIDSVSVLKMNIEGAEYSLLHSLTSEDFKKIDQIVVSFHHFSDDTLKESTNATIQFLENHGYTATLLDERFGWYLFVSKKSASNVTLVTGLWDLGRGDINGWANRDFETYKNNFFKLLEVDIPMCVWIPRSLEKDVWKIRNKSNTKVFFKEVEDFKNWFPFFEKHDNIRTSPEWFNLAGWLPDSPQAKLPFYNPMMFCKMFMVNDSALHNPFNSEYYYWIDGGLTNTVSLDIMSSGEVFTNISEVYSDSIVNIAYPYEPHKEIHGFEKQKFFEYCDLPDSSKQVFISRGGFWGGHKKLIHEYNNHYYSVMYDTIENGYIGADECLFTILAYKFPRLVERFDIDGNGLVWPFFQAMQDVSSFKKQASIALKASATTNLYVLGFNSPDQFKNLCESFAAGDSMFLSKPRKILINNSTDTSTFAAYDQLCKQYDFEEIHFDNIGICGGRQYIAEHFEESGAQYCMFFEDDMNINGPDVSPVHCRLGFTRYIPGLYKAVHNIMNKENFDFLKFSFSEFYGDNSVQFSWYNVPQKIRSEIWPTYDKLPERGLDANSPKTEFKHIKSLNGISYITGEVFYSNWPQIVSKAGSKKMFLDTKWDRPFEQTWMSHIFQKTISGDIKPAVLLISPITHDRFAHYPAEHRREN